MKRNFYQIKWVSWSFVVIWMGVIFWFSHQTASESSDLSSGVLSLVFSFIDVVFSGKVSEDFLHFFIRKAGHFTVYFVLGFLVVHALFHRGIWWYDGVWALIICLVYAISDEVHQLFVPGRSGEVRDVLLDSSGALVGIVFYLFLRWFFSKRN